MKKSFLQRFLAAVCLLLIMLFVPGRSSAVTVNESDVTLLEAIKSTGAQAFNTGYTHKANTRVELDCNVTKNSQRDWEALFGGRLKDFRSNAFCFFTRHHNGTNSAQDAPCFNRTGKETNGSGFVYGERVKVVAEGQTARWYRYSDLNTQVGKVTTTGTADEGKTPMFLFNLNTADSEGGTKPDTSPSVMTLYGCKIYEGETLKCDFVPARYNGTVGLFDRVNKTFSGTITGKPFEAVGDPSPDTFDGTELLKNGQCDGTYNNWNANGGGSGWDIKTLDDGTKFWASSYLICTLSQTVVLSQSGFSDADIDAGKVQCKASADMFSGWITNDKGAKVADVKVEMLDASDNVLSTITVLNDLRGFNFLMTFKTDIFTLQSGTRKLKFIVRGQDPLPNGWAGQFGPHYNNLSLKAKVTEGQGGGDDPVVDPQTAFEAALAAIEDGKSYRMFTMYNSEKYYVTGEGKLSKDVADAPAFKFKKVSASNSEYVFGFQLENNGYYFTNPKEADEASLTLGQLNTTNKNARNDWEAQVFFLNEGKYAVRATNAKSGTSGWNWVGGAFWTVNAGPKAEYSWNANYCWQLEVATNTTPDNPTVPVNPTIPDEPKIPNNPKIPAGAIDISTIDDAYTAKNGDVISGIGGSNFRLIINYGATVTLHNAYIAQVPNESYGIKCLGDAKIILKGTNVVKAGSGKKSGIFVPQSKTLTIEGDGSLYVKGSQGSGIGDGWQLESCGNIVINSGTITAIGGMHSAGIGSSFNVSCGTITINGGTVIAKGGSESAGIGCGREGRCGKITINEGIAKVIAIKGNDSPNAVGLGKNSTFLGGIAVPGVNNNNYSESPYILVGINEANFPNSNFRSFLLSQSYGADEFLNSSEIAAITTLDVQNKNISSLKGIENFPALTYLDCRSNAIQEDAMEELVNSLPIVTNGTLCVVNTNMTSNDNVCLDTHVQTAKDKGWRVVSSDGSTVTDYEGVKPYQEYPVWVGETQVDERNMDDVLGDGNVSYVPDKGAGTLTFKQATSTINGMHNAAKIYADNIDLTINAPKGLSIENNILGISLGDNRKLTVNGDITFKTSAPPLDGCSDFTVNGNLTSTSLTPLSPTTLTVNGNVNMTSSSPCISATTVVLNGTKHELHASSPCISATTITITGDLTASSNDCPALSARGDITMVSGTWTLDGGNYSPIGFDNGAGTLKLPDGYRIIEPKDAHFDKNFRNDLIIVDANGDMVSHVVIGKAHVHTLETIPGTQPSCTEPGRTESVVCSECGEVIEKAMEIPALGHTWGDWVVTREAEPGKPGEETRTCMNDASHKETRAIEYQLAINEKNFPDAAFRKYVQENFDNNNDQKLNDGEIAAVDHIQAMKLDIADLTGIENFSALTTLTVHYNKLTKLDVSKNTALTSLACAENLLTELDVSKNTALTLIECSHNLLTKLDLSNNKALTSLYCANNQIHDEAMDALIASLPEVTEGVFAAFDPTEETEQNVVTKAQVAEAKKKGWTTYRISEDTALWYEEYEGYEPPVPDGITAASTVNDADSWYDLKGRKLSGKPTKKGLYIRNGRKVVIE